MIGLLTEQTCGDACWHAKDETCRCSCAGRNHGCLRNADGEQPVRTAKIDGTRHKLIAVGTESEIHKQAHALNVERGNDFVFADSARDFLAGPAKRRFATISQVQNWPELTAYRGGNRPSLLWLEL